MANTSFNTLGLVVTPAAPASGSFSGFTALANTRIISLIDFEGNQLADPTYWTLSAGTTIPLYCTYIKLDSGTVVAYPISLTIPQI
jgi:hypothetical protein